MTRAEFSRRILDMGGTYADVNRLDEEGVHAAADAHGYEFPIANMETLSFCYEIGREFVIDNMGDMDDLFQLDPIENREEQRKINRWNYIMRNIGNIALCLSAYANEHEADGVTWADVSAAGKILDELRKVCEFANIKVKEV